MRRIDSPSPASSPQGGVTWQSLLLTLLITFAAVTALVVSVSIWVWQHYAARVTLKDQSAKIRLPSTLTVKADVRDLVDIRIDQDVTVQVPIKHEVNVPFDAPIALDVHVDTVVPIHMDVPVEQTVHVDQQVVLDTQVKTRILGFPVTVPIQGQVPIKLDIPVKLTVPIRQQLPVSLSVPASVRLLKPLPVKIDTIIRTTVPIHESLRVPVTAPVHAKLHFPEQNIDAGLSFMDMTLPLSAVHFAPLSSGPTRR